MIAKSKRTIGKIDWFEREWLIMEILLSSPGEKNIVLTDLMLADTLKVT